MGTHVVVFLANIENRMKIHVVVFLANIENKDENGNTCGSIPCKK